MFTDFLVSEQGAEARHSLYDHGATGMGSRSGASTIQTATVDGGTPVSGRRARTPRRAGEAGVVSAAAGSGDAVEAAAGALVAMAAVAEAAAAVAGGLAAQGAPVEACSAVHAAVPRNLAPLMTARPLPPRKSPLVLEQLKRPLVMPLPLPLCRRWVWPPWQGARRWCRRRCRCCRWRYAITSAAGGAPCPM